MIEHLILKIMALKSYIMKINNKEVLNISTYVTYGLGNKFVLEKVLTNLNDRGIGKPERAWWGSPIDAEYGWKQWAEDNDFLPHGYHSFKKYFAPKNAIYWELVPGSRVLHIINPYDLQNWVNNGYIKSISKESRFGSFDIKFIDFEAILKDGYDAVELCDSSIGHRFVSNIEMLFNSWDCESIVVLNPNKIIQVDNPVKIKKLKLRNKFSEQTT